MIDPSSRNLLEVFSSKIILGALANAIFMFFLGLASWYEAFPLVAAFLALTMAVVMNLHRGLHRMIFPVSDRQVAWLPMFITALLWLAGLAGLLLVQIIKILADFHEFVPTVENWLHWLPAMPFSVFCIVAVLRAERINKGYSLIAITLIILYPYPLPWGAQDIPLPHAWRIFLPASLFLILEAPAHWASLRLRGASATSKPSELEWDSSAPTPFRPITLVGDAILWFLIFPFAAGLAYYLVQGMRRLLQNPRLLVQNPAYLLLLLTFNMPWHLARALYHQHRASGFRPMASLGLLALRATLVLNPLVTALGVRRGQAIRCFFCGQPMLIWLERCPHCQAHNPVHDAVLRPALAPAAVPASVRQVDPAWGIYWIQVPLFILLILFGH